MLNKELSNSIAELKNPERKLNVIISVIIVSVLWGSLVLVVRNWGTDKAEENKQLKIENKDLHKDKDSLMNMQYQYVVEQLKQEKQVKQFTESWDSLNTELLKIKHELISK